MTELPGFDRRRLLLLLAPLAIYGLTYMVMDQARPGGVPFPHLTVEGLNGLPVGVAAAQAKYHYYWLSSYVVLTAVCLAVCFSAGLALRRETPVRDRNVIGWCIALLVLLVVVIELFGGVTRWYKYMGEGLYDAIFTNIATLRYNTALSVYLHGQNIIKIAVAVSVVVLSVCMILTLKRPPEHWSMADKARFLRRAQLAQRNYLQQAALVYVFAVIAMIAGMYWPLPFLDGNEAQAAYLDLLTGVAILQGVAFSLGAAAVYLPAALVLRQWSEAVTKDLAGESVMDGETEAAVETLAIHPFDQLRQVAMMIMPMLVSLAPLLGGISGLG